MSCSRIPNSLLRLLDFFIVCFFMSPLVVCYWQGTWLLMDIYIFPDSLFDSALMSTGLGVIFSHCILATQGWIVEKLSNYNKHYLQLAWKICIYVTSIFSVSFWRGVWMMMDLFAGFNLTVFLVSHGMAFVFLTITRTTSSVVFCPGYLLKDETVSPSTTFNFNAMPLLICIKDKSLKMFFSHFLTVFLVSPVIVWYWRGTWNLCVYLANMAVGTGLPTCIANVSFGYVVCLLCFLISQPLERRLSGESLPYFVKAFIEHVFIYVLGFASVNVWSALWFLVDHFLVIPGQENNHLSALIRHCISFIALYLAQGTINLVGAPAGCRTHGRNTLEGLFMGTYFVFSEPCVTGNRVEVTPRSITRNKSSRTQSESDDNATHAGEIVIGNGSNATHTELYLNEEEINATHNEGNVICKEGNSKDIEVNESKADIESNAIEENKHPERGVTEYEDNATGTAMVPRVVGSGNTAVQESHK